MKHLEFELQKKIANYLNVVHPKILYLSDTIANIKLTPQQQQRNKLIQKAGFKCPDVLILKPNEKYHSLFLELKLESPYKKDGSLKKQMIPIYKKIGGKKIKIGEYNHLEEQERTLKELNNLGFYACFVWSYEAAIQIIDNYVKNILE